MSVQRFLKHLEFEKRYSAHTIIAYKNDLSQFSKFLLITFDIPTIMNAGHTHIRSWNAQLIEDGITPRSINRKLSSLKSYFKFLQNKELLKTNPAAKITSPKVPKRLPVYVEKENINLLFSAVEFENDFEGLRDRLILEMFYATGMRRAELINLKTSDIDFFNNNIKVLGKGKKERIIPIHSQLKNLISEYEKMKAKMFESRDEFYLFVTGKGKKVYPNLVYKIVKKYLSLITTLEKKSPHVLRHTFATHLSNSGADLNAIKELLGHSSLASTQVYTHNTIEKLKEIHKQAHPKA